MSKAVVTRAARDFMDLFAVDERGLSIDGIDMVDLTHRYAALEAALSQVAEPEQPEFLPRLVENAFSWGKQDCNYLNPKHIDAFLKSTRDGLVPEDAARWTGEGVSAHASPIRSAQEAGTPAPEMHVIPPHIRNFLGKVQGVCMGVAMSGEDHPNPDGVLMELVEEAQELLFPIATTEVQP